MSLYSQKTSRYTPSIHASVFLAAISPSGTPKSCRAVSAMLLVPRRALPNELTAPRARLPLDTGAIFHNSGDKVVRPLVAERGRPPPCEARPAQIDPLLPLTSCCRQRQLPSGQLPSRKAFRRTVESEPAASDIGISRIVTIYGPTTRSGLLACGFTT